MSGPDVLNTERISPPSFLCTVNIFEFHRELTHAMVVSPDADEREQLERLTTAWEEFDRTYDLSTVADFLAEDMLILPPGESPIEGKAAALEYLDRPEAEASPDIDQWPEHIFVSGDLAVVQVGVAAVPDEADAPLEDGLKGLDVYRREEDGDWEQIITIWNDQI